jgi:MFS family permease
MTVPLADRPDDSRRVSALLGLLFGVAGMGSSSAAIVLPRMAQDYGITVAQGAWTISLYVLMLGVTTALYGRISDLVGIRRPLAFGVAMMVGGAVVAALAPSYGVHLAGRILQGAGAAAVPTLGVAASTARYEGSVRSLGLGRLAGMTAVLSGLGPLLGGAVEAVAGWRAVMVLPVLAVLVLPFVWHALRTEGTGHRLDLVGAVLVALTAGGMVLLVQSPSTGLVVALVGAVLLVVGAPAVALWVRRRPLGFLPVDVLRNGTVLRSSLAAAAIPAGWFALLISVPAILLARSWEPWQVGLLLIPGAVTGLFTPRFAGRLLDRIGAAASLVIASVGASVSLLLAMAGALWTSPVLLALSVMVISTCFAIGQPALMGAVGDAVHVDIRGVALGIATLLFLTGGSVGSAIVGGLGDVIGFPLSILLLAVLPLLGAAGLVPSVRAARQPG